MSRYTDVNNPLRALGSYVSFSDIITVYPFVNHMITTWSIRSK